MGVATLSLLLVLLGFLSAYSLPLHGGEAVATNDLTSQTQQIGRHKAEVAHAWFTLASDLVKSEKWIPPNAARLFGYLGITLYESIVPGTSNLRSLAGQINGLSNLPEVGTIEYHWPTVANSAAATAMRSFFSTAKGASLRAIDDLQRSNEEANPLWADEDVARRSKEFGQLIAIAIFEWSLRDGYLDINDCEYTLPSGAGIWRPTPPMYAPPLQPCWGKLRTFVIENGADCAPVPPPPYSENDSSRLFKEMSEVYTVGHTLTDEQKTIARYWADNPGKTASPAGHSIAILTQALRATNASLAVAAEAYAKVGMAVADAFIACWWAKYEYNLLRPVTYIREQIDASWTPFLMTPEFPEYTSGHSAQAAAAAAVLTALFGRNFAFTDRTHESRGIAPRSFKSFSEAADESAISRLYGGIHYRAAIDEGLRQGKCVGDRINLLKITE